MKRILSLSLGEVVLKGANRRFFIRRIVQNIESVLEDIGYISIIPEMGKIQVEIDPAREEESIERLRHVFGIVYISPSVAFDADWERLKAESVRYVEAVLEAHPEMQTFKVVTKRSDKSFPLNSQEINRELGAIILDAFEEKLSVDVHAPDLMLYVDVKKEMYLYHEKISTYGGLPLGSNGKGLLLLSGGIDSPVAGFLMAKRGVQMDALHFHSYPFTSPQAEDKVMRLAKILTRYTTKMNVYSVNLLPIQKEINKNCPPEQMTVLSRRFMMRIANRLAEKHGYLSLTTGENLGQVASQTIHGLDVTDDVAKPVVFRPLIGMDKVDIIRWAERIGTYETSIEPFEDCCTVFLPKHPSLRPTVEEMEASEALLPIEEMLDASMETLKITRIRAKEKL
ncbi:thiamine biosynthesis protein ThiI [Peptoniphilus ivorii]|uniref:tRNA uracil 4-sulfurtransferase ThiI n=1 Tax=Aedoeadaptatus ivorii TaxID=54006 RepID=UPI00278106A7|nr:tRNA uracil 4-sulfurtransferase ThiI [Peptoniphilus ivorii]MDQ0508985.1 thiamine biosynthesis protein ThiI [Peptoniphilus ivorii]